MSVPSSVIWESPTAVAPVNLAIVFSVPEPEMPPTEGYTFVNVIAVTPTVMGLFVDTVQPVSASAEPS